MPDFSYLKNPDLPLIRSDYPGNKFAEGRFYNEQPRYQPGFRDIFGYFTKGNPQAKEKKKDDFRVACIKGDAFFDAQEDMIVWLGHASFFIRIGGLSILTDPCLRSLPLLKRMVEPPCPLSAIRGLDYILMSHGHRDHFDTPSLKEILKGNPEVEFLIPLKLEDLLTKETGHTRYQSAGWYQQYKTPPQIEINFLPAIHWNRRYLTDFNDMLWGSFLLRTPAKTLFFAGDTAYGPHFGEIKETVGEIDICIMPVGAYKPREMMQSSHTSPQESIQAFHELDGKVFIPMHYGTYDLSQEPPGEPVRIIRQHADSGQLRGKAEILSVGETYLLDS